MDKIALEKEIRGIKEECSGEGWDGYGANPVTEDACNRAIQFIRALPDDVMQPEPCPESDGGIGLEWRKGSDILCLSTDIRISYAYLIGIGKGHGVADFDGFTIPDLIIDLIRRFNS